MIDKTHDPPITRRARALGISRGGVDDQPRPVFPSDLAVMRRIDEPHLNYPFAGSRMLRDLLVLEGIEVLRPRVATPMTPMKRMAIEAIHRKPRLCLSLSISSPWSMGSAALFLAIEYRSA